VDEQNPVQPENYLLMADILMRLGIPVRKVSLEVADYPGLVAGSPARVVVASCMDRRYMRRVEAEV